MSLEFRSNGDGVVRLRGRPEITAEIDGTDHIAVSSVYPGGEAQHLSLHVEDAIRFGRALVALGEHLREYAPAGDPYARLRSPEGNAE